MHGMAPWKRLSQKAARWYGVCNLDMGHDADLCPDTVRPRGRRDGWWIPLRVLFGLAGWSVTSERRLAAAVLAFADPRSLGRHSAAYEQRLLTRPPRHGHLLLPHGHGRIRSRRDTTVQTH